MIENQNNMTPEEKTIKIISIILEEVNGFDNQDANKLAPDNIGSTLYEKILDVIKTR